MARQESNGVPQRYCGLGSRPPNKECHNKLSCNLFAGEASCLWFVENTPPVMLNKAMHTKIRCVCVGFGMKDNRLVIVCVYVRVCVFLLEIT